MEPIISPDNALALWTILLGITAAALWAEKKPVGKFFGAAVLAIVGGFILGNARVMPVQSDLYLAVDEILLPVAIPLLLFHANINKIAKESGATLIAFGVGAFATVVGAFIAFSVINLPAYQADFTGTIAATFIGGGMNFAAVSQALEIPPGELLTAAIAADNIVTILFLLLLAVMPAIKFFANKYPGERPAENPEELQKKKEGGRMQDYSTAMMAIFIAFLLVLVGNLAQEHIGWRGTGIFTTTLLALLYATYAPELTGKLKGSFDVGMVLMIIFFASLGARADLLGTLEAAPVFFAFVLIVVGVHAVILFTAGKFLKLTLPELIIGSNACILGPATAAGLAGTKGWHSLVTPGLLVGILGYAIANFIGIGLANFLG